MSFDGNYDSTRPWGGQGGSGFVQSPYNTPTSGAPKWSYNGPWASNMERLTQQALMVATIPGAQLQQMVRPPLPQIRVFPDRFGFGERTQPTIEDVVSVDRVYTEPRVSWYSGSPAGYSGSSRNSLAGD
ncbi:hypothetical protein UFOVP45_83 [uncultured Caudovirales phage]|uniref:Uncharacterized protein n=1 Tax=uncultured Caudovirales phage TaxID=2100421 RepID=A0A6J5KSF2_9CAUD|nr:hypothetical protein UFOVP45_83 [uncultured Caudovirales phage]